MKTKRILSAEDAILFFNTSINTMDDAIGIALVNIKDKRVSFDFNAVLLLRFDGIYANTDYTIKSDLFEEDFITHLKDTCTKELNEKSDFEYQRKIGKSTFNFLVKIEKYNKNTVKLYFICIEKLLDTEEQLDLFSKVVGSGLSLFAGSAFWIDYDKNTMKEIMKKFQDSGAWNLPVIKNGIYLGFISKSRLLTAYRRKIIEVTN